MDSTFFLILFPLFAGYVLDLLLGDPISFPHPVKGFGWLIAFGEKRLNAENFRFVKGMFFSLLLVVTTFLFFEVLIAELFLIHLSIGIIFSTILIYFGLANRNLIDEGRAVFKELNEKGLDAGRKRLSYIVGRDTSKLSAQQIRVAVFETLSENLSDGVVAPLFYYMLAGVPGMMAYKMVNTLDSMIGYKNDRYFLFGKFAARMDDVANFIPARLTAFFMILVTWSSRGFRFVLKYGSKHSSPNSGYPEAALAGILDVRFGGPNVYHGKVVEKPYIGTNEREIQPSEIDRVAKINHAVTAVCVALVGSILIFIG
jgi:adenosylcobinamide-phosphate synthase